MKDLVGKTVKVFLKKDDVKSPDFREGKLLFVSDDYIHIAVGSGSVLIPKESINRMEVLQ